MTSEENQGIAQIIHVPAHKVIITIYQWTLTSVEGQGIAQIIYVPAHKVIITIY